MRYLLDTHTLLWAAFNQKKLSRRVRIILLSKQTVAMVSAASAWEIATKVRLGRMPEAQALEQDFIVTVQQAGYEIREVTTADFLRAGRLAAEHGDPFDRVIAAQALADDVPILSLDGKLDDFGVRRIW